MDLEKELQAMKNPLHIVHNRGHKIGVGKWFNMLTDETYANDAVLIEYLKTYKPLPEWYTLESYKEHLRKKGKLRGEIEFSLSM